MALGSGHFKMNTRGPVAAVILNYRNSEETIECVKSLSESSYTALEITVVDNASGDGSADRIRIACPHVKVIENLKNGGYAGGMNFGIRAALIIRPDYLFITNGDTLYERDYVSILVAAMEKEPDAMVGCGTIYSYREKSKVWYGGGQIIGWRASGFSRSELPRLDGCLDHAILPVTFVSGCSFLARSIAFEKVGLFDEQFFMYAEDTEFSARITRNGGKLIYVPSAAMYHRVPRVNNRPLPLYYNTRNRLLFLRLSIRGHQKILGFAYVALTYVGKLALWKLMAPELYMAAKWGIEDFLKQRFYEGRGPKLKFLLKGGMKGTGH